MTTKTNREAVATEPVACRRCGGIGLVEWTPPEGYVLGYDDIGRMTPCPVCSTRSAPTGDSGALREALDALEPFANYKMNAIEFRDGRITIPEQWLNRARDAYRALSKVEPSK